MESTLLKTKLRLPPTRRRVVPRPRLLARLDAGRKRKLTLVSAPAGFGKSTLVSNWLAEQPGTAWLALDPGDSEARRFWRYVLAAFQTVEPGFGAEARQHLNSGQSTNQRPAMVSILNEISEGSLELTLVLEDYHTISTQDVHDGLSFFVEQLPPSMHLVLLTRIDPPLPLGRLRASGDLAEVRSADLKFSLDETSEFLDRFMDLNLDSDHVHALHDRTEGWVAGLQMAGLSMQGLEGPEQVAAFIDDFTGSHRHIFDYLTDEVLSLQAPKTQTFLLKTSLLDQFNASLCTAVTRDENSQDMLEYLESANLFLFPLDENRQWYRYHQLFATLLQHRLSQRTDLSIRELHQRAAVWFEARGIADRAIEHFREAEDPAGVARLIRQYGTDRLQPGRLHELQRWLDILPSQFVQEDAQLASLQAWIYYFEQRTNQAARWVEYAQRSSEEERAQDPSTETWGKILGLQSWIACQQGDFAHGIELAQEALERLPAAAHTWRGINYKLLAEALAGDGRTADAIAAYETSFQYQPEASNWIATSTITAAIWMTAMLRGRLHEARRQFDQVIATLTELGQSINASTLRMARLGILYEQNDLDQVGAELSDLWKLIKYDSTIATARHQYLSARYYSAVGDREKAYRSLQILEEAAASWHTPDEQARAIGGLMRIYLRLGERRRTERWLRSVSYDNDSLTLLRMDEYLAIADVIRFQDSPLARQDGLQLVEGLLRLCDELEVFGIKNEVYCLQALLLAAEGDKAGALTALGHALARGEPERYVRTFVDFGEPMAGLLWEAVSRNIHPAYAGFLLSQFPQAEQARPGKKGVLSFVEPLSDREVEVLSLLATHLTGPEIAARLHISPNTLKTHTRKIYRKIGVHTRSEAVIAAQTAGLL